MPDLQVNFFNSSFFFYSHDTRFVTASSSQEHAGQSQNSDAAGDVTVGLTALGFTINQLEPGYRALRPIPLTIAQHGGGFTASFDVANIHTSGDTLIGAAQNLRSLILDIFDSLTAEPLDKLGPGPKRQLCTLLRYVEKNHPQ